MDERIKCGKCSSEFYPRDKKESKEKDYSCPVCGFGSFKESYFKTEQKMLLDGRMPNCS